MLRQPTSPTPHAPGVAPASRRAPAALLLAALLAACACVLLAGLSEPPVHREAEVRVETVTRNMLASGDWLVPRLDGGAARLQKPPLYYWLACAASVVLGPGRFALRLPAALASLSLLLLAFACGRRLGSARVGLLAAACLACMPGLAEFGRLGVAETLLAATAGLALAAFGADLDAGRRAGWPVAAGFGLAVLAKATVALLVVGLPIVLALVLARQVRRLASRRALTLAGLALLPALAWYAAVLARVPGAMDSLGSFALLPFGVRLPEAAGNAAHVRPAWYYLVELPTLCVPLLPLLPLVALRAWRTRGWRERPGLRFAALAFAAPLVAFSLIPQKQDHYLLPLLLPLSLLLADTLDDACRRAVAPGWRTAAAACVVLVAAGGLALLFVARGAFGADLPACIAAGAAGALLLGWMLRQAWRARVSRFAGGLAVASLACMLFWFSVADVERQKLDAGQAGAEDQAHWRQVAREHPAIGQLFRVPRGRREEGG